jgi:hypothetical protein
MLVAIKRLGFIRKEVSGSELLAGYAQRCQIIRSFFRQEITFKSPRRNTVFTAIA